MLTLISESTYRCSINNICRVLCARHTPLPHQRRRHVVVHRRLAALSQPAQARQALLDAHDRRDRTRPPRPCRVRVRQQRAPRLSRRTKRKPTKRKVFFLLFNEQMGSDVFL